LFCLFFLFSGLLKITSTFTLVATSALFFIETIGLIKLKKNEKLFKNPLIQLIPFAVVFIVLFFWFRFAYNYNKEYNSGFFLIGILPIWDIDKETILRVFDAIKYHYRNDYFNRWVQIILIIFFAFVVISKNKTPKFLFYLTIVSSFGFLLYILLYFQALEHHDYYVTNFLILMPIILTTFFIVLKKNYPRLFSSFVFKLITLIFVSYNVFFAAKKINERYSASHWINNNRTNFTYGLEDITPYLRSLGIERNDKVIFLGDGSINISLYLMDQKGWSNYGMSLKDTSRINRWIKNGANYILTYDKKLYNDEYLKQYFINKVGEYKNVEIFHTSD
jgi:hypothetical protein